MAFSQGKRARRASSYDMEKAQASLYRAGSPLSTDILPYMVTKAIFRAQMQHYDAFADIKKAIDGRNYFISDQPVALVP
jgi:hypothetical protein